MGVDPTRDLTREEALQAIRDALDSATNAELALALFALTQDRELSNYRVTDEGI